MELHIKRWVVSAVAVLLLAPIILVSSDKNEAQAGSGTIISEADFNKVARVETSNYAVSDQPTYDDGFTLLQADSLSSTGCTKGHRGYQIDAYNNFGNHIWAFGGYLQDCVKGGKVVHKRWGVCWGWVSDNILNRWQFQGCNIEDQSVQTLPRAYIWRQWRGHFKSCVYIVGCQTKDPWVYIGGRGDGSFGTNGDAS